MLVQLRIHLFLLKKGVVICSKNNIYKKSIKYYQQTVQLMHVQQLFTSWLFNKHFGKSTNTTGHCLFG